jgi:hypothetical protein
MNTMNVLMIIDALLVPAVVLLVIANILAELREDGQIKNPIKR